MSEKPLAYQEGNILSMAMQRMDTGENFSLRFHGGKARLAHRLIEAFERYAYSQAKSDLLRLALRIFLTPVLSAIYLISQNRNYRTESEVFEDELTLFFKAPASTN